MVTTRRRRRDPETPHRAADETVAAGQSSDVNIDGAGHIAGVDARQLVLAVQAHQGDCLGRLRSSPCQQH